MGSREKESVLVNEFGNHEINDNSVNLLNNQGSQLPLLPMEIIMEIISHLNEITDIRSCMLLCKQIRVLIYKTPKIMRKIVLTMDIDTYGLLELPIIKKRGKFIRNLEITYFKYICYERLFYILSKVPNLEKLSFKCNKDDKSLNELKLLELKHLKAIQSNDPCHRCFLSDSANITKLEALKFCCLNLEDSEILANFLCRQTKLKELTVVENFGHQNFFLIRDISDEIQFKLTKFVYTLDECSENFLNFLKNQSGNLKELKIAVHPNFHVLNTIFTKCKKLEKFTTAQNCQFTLDDPSSWVLKTLKHFIAPTTTSIDISVIYKRFPNLVLLVCLDLVPYEGIFQKLETFSMLSPLDCRRFNKLKLPNLKNLIVGSVEGNIWKNIKGNFPKIENLAFVGDCPDLLAILKSLDYFKELRTFKQMYERRNADEVMYMKLLIDYTDFTFYRSWSFDCNVIKYIDTKYCYFTRINSKNIYFNELYFT